MRTLVQRCSWLVLLSSILLFTWVFIGHYYRLPIENQFDNYHDGVSLFSVPDGYPENRNPVIDKFSIELYNEITSVSEAIAYIRVNYEVETDIQAMNAVFDFTSRRYIHRMYPHHTWLTNPFFAGFELYDPLNSFNEMSTADELLRHSAVAACGDASVTAIEIYRGLGFQAQYVSLGGHHIAEFMANGKPWLVDADMEVMAPYSIKQISSNTSLIDDIYSKYPIERRTNLKNIFKTKAQYNGLDGAPRYGDYMWDLHNRVELFKWVIPISMSIFSGLLILFLRRKRLRITMS